VTDAVFGALARAIEAIGRHEFYPAMTEYLRHCLDYDNVIVIVFTGTSVPDVLYKRIYGPDVFRYIAEQYLPAAYLLDPIYHFHLRRGKAGLYRLLDVAPDQFRRSRYFKWYYGRIGITDEISVVLPVGENTTITISLGKDGTSGHVFSQKAEEFLRQHEPVIMSLIGSHWVASGSSVAAKTHQMSITHSLIAAVRACHKVVLSPRQAETALLILQGHSSPSIGLHLGVSPQTVKVFRKQLYRKCGISSQAELFALMMPILERTRGASFEG
jgi:DNA-binding CsgD family transcriptional regulator